MDEPEGLTQLSDLLDRYVDGDTSVLLRPETAKSMGALLSATAPPLSYRTLQSLGLSGLIFDEPVLDAFHLLARFHAYRSDEYAAHSSDIPLAVGDRVASAVLFAIVHTMRPGSVPPSTRAVADGLGTEPAALWRAYAGLLCSQGRTHADTALEDRGIAWLRGIYGHLSADDPNRADTLTDLSGALFSRYQHRGNPSDLDEAIEAGLRGADGQPSVNAGHAAALMNVSLALRARYERFALPADIHWAVDTGRRALAACPADSPDRPLLLGTLGATLRLLNEHTHNPGELAEAASLLRRAVTTIPKGHPFLATHRSNLGAALVRQYETDPGDGRTLDEAIEHLRLAAQLPHPRRAAYRANLGSALFRRWSDASRPRREDLEAAVHILTEAYGALGPQDPDREPIGALLATVRRAL